MAFSGVRDKVGDASGQAFPGVPVGQVAQHLLAAAPPRLGAPAREIAAWRDLLNEMGV